MIKAEWTNADALDLQPTCNQLATDTISRQAAINEIDEWIKAFLENGHKESAADACLIQDGIIQLPSAQPEQPTEVQDILQYLDEYLHPIVSPEHWSVYSELYDMVSMLPSAQPDIIQCRNCKFASGDSRICMKFGHSPIGELDFCAWAERRADER